VAYVGPARHGGFDDRVLAAEVRAAVPGLRHVVVAGDPCPALPEGIALASLSPRRLAALVEIVRNNSRLMREPVHRRFDGDLVFFTAAAPRRETWLDRNGWRRYASGIANHDVACVHPAMLRPGPLERIGAPLAARLD
jgi:hypothetical protein